MEFIALDVETANPDPGSICQIGLVAFRSGEVVSRWVRYVDPGCSFAGVNVSIHGIDENTVAGAPRLEQVLPPPRGLLSGRIVATHSVFDRTALDAAAAANGMEPFACRWLDVSRVARHVWPEAKGGYGLANLCAMIGHRFDGHDALRDAEACGILFLNAQELTGLGAADWHERLVQTKPARRRREYPKSRDLKGHPDGPLKRQTVVFTGALSVPRAKAEEMAVAAGCNVARSVTMATTMLVVGEQDPALLKGHKKSSKQRKAEELIEDDYNLEIIGEKEFLRRVTEGLVTEGQGR